MRLMNVSSMNVCLQAVAITASVFFSTTLFGADSRLWTSLSGNVEIQAEAIAFSETLVVLKRPSGELLAVELNELSEKDQEYVRSKENVETMKKSADEMQTWTSKDGMKVEGRVLAYGRKEVLVQRRFSQPYVDGKKFSDMDALHQRLTLRIISHLEKTTIENAKQLDDWAKTQGNAGKTYMLEGVLMELASGDEIGVPFFMFAPDELKILEPGWELWLERQESEEQREQESFLVRSQAMAYQQDRAQQQQIEMLKLNLLAAATGAIGIWQVGLAPGPGVFGRPVSLMVPAQTSQQATAIALQNYPGYGIVGVRRASR